MKQGWGLTSSVGKTPKTAIWKCAGWYPPNHHFFHNWTWGSHHPFSDALSTGHQHVSIDVWRLSFVLSWTPTSLCYATSRRSHAIMFQRICWNRFVYFCCGEDLHKIFRDLHRNQTHNVHAYKFFDSLCTCRWFGFRVEGLMAAGETVASSWIIQDWLGYGSNSAAKMDLHLLNTINQIWVSGKIRSLQN